MPSLLLYLAPFAALVIVPLGLRLLGAPPFARRAIGPVALLLAASFWVEQGPLAAALCAPYALFTLWLAARALRRGRLPLEERCHQAALLHLAAGGMAMVLARLGIRFPGYTEPLILLTAIHFHYGGFALCLFAAQIVRAVSGRLPQAVLRITAGAAMVGMPVLTIGIGVSRWLEGAAGLLLAADVAVLAGLGLFVAPLRFTLPAASAVLSMALAAIYARGAFRQRFEAPFPEMAFVHGMAAALGFTLVGLLCWITLTRPNSSPSPSPPGPRPPAG